MDLSPEEEKLFRKLDCPAKIQDFLNSLVVNYEVEGPSCQSPRMVLRSRKAHCMEGAMLAAAILKFHGRPPLLVDLETEEPDFDHVLAVFKENGFWGAITKTNHAVLRYREPVYRSVRELVMSYFHEYFLDSGRKTLRTYSLPVNLDRFRGWETSEEEVWHIPEHLTTVKHFSLLDKWQVKGLRDADEVEIKAGKVVEQVPPKGARWS